MTARGTTATSISAGVLSIALLGDALLYVVLPVNAAQFGITLAWVGVLLSANRIIRIFTYSQVVWLADTIGLKRISVVAAVGGAGSTLLYGLGEGGPVLLFARIIWGLSFAAMSLTTLAYAVDDRKHAGARVGLSRAILQIGPALSLTLGAWLAGILGAQSVFLVLGITSLAAIPLAFFLPAESKKPTPMQRSWFPKPVRSDLLFFVVGFSVDGVFVMTITLVFLETASVEVAMLSGGVLLASHRLAEIILAPIGGAFGDKIGVWRLLNVSVIALAVGFAAIGSGAIYTGAGLIIMARSVIAAVGPAAIVESVPPQNTMHRLAVMQTWRDFGSALGPLVSGFLYAGLGASIVYFGIVPMLLGMLILMVAPGRSVNVA